MVPKGLSSRDLPPHPRSPRLESLVRFGLGKHQVCLPSHQLKRNLTGRSWFGHAWTIFPFRTSGSMLIGGRGSNAQVCMGSNDRRPASRGACSRRRSACRRSSSAAKPRRKGASLIPAEMRKNAQQSVACCTIMYHLERWNWTPPQGLVLFASANNPSPAIG